MNTHTQYIYIHTHIQTLTKENKHIKKKHTNTQKHPNEHKHTQIHTYTKSHSHTYRHTNILKIKLTFIFPKETHIYTHEKINKNQSDKNIHTNKHIHIYTHTYTNTHKGKQTY